MKEKMKEIALKVGAFGTLAVTQANHLLYADAFDKANDAAGALKSRLITLATVLFPLAVVICAIAMFFTRDQKKFDTEKHILIGCCLAFFLVLLVKNDLIVQTIENLFGGNAENPHGISTPQGEF